jgi:hypothetical protein
MYSYFRMLAACTRQQSQATLLAGLSVLVLVITTGYAIPVRQELGWYRFVRRHPSLVADIFQMVHQVLQPARVCVRSLDGQ